MPHRPSELTQSERVPTQIYNSADDACRSVADAITDLLNERNAQTSLTYLASSRIKAIRRLPKARRPKKLIGCEIWRDLDWMPDNKKIVMNVSSRPELPTHLNGLFVSQISGGKRYDLAAEGQRRANATFLDSHSVDNSQSVAFGIDLTPLIEDDALFPEAYILSFITEFQQDMHKQVSTFF